MSLSAMNQKSPDAKILSQKMEQKIKSFESSLTCAGDSNLSLSEMNQNSPDAEILSRKMEQKVSHLSPH